MSSEQTRLALRGHRSLQHSTETFEQDTIFALEPSHVHLGFLIRYGQNMDLETHRGLLSFFLLLILLSRKIAVFGLVWLPSGGPRPDVSTGDTNTCGQGRPKLPAKVQGPKYAIQALSYPFLGWTPDLKGVIGGKWQKVLR